MSRRLRKVLAALIIALLAGTTMADIGASARGGTDRSLMRDLGAGSIVIAIAAAYIWAIRELEGQRADAD